MYSALLTYKEAVAGRRKKKLRGDRQWGSRVYAGWRTDDGGYLAFFSVAGARSKIFFIKFVLFFFYYYIILYDRTSSLCFTFQDNLFNFHHLQLCRLGQRSSLCRNLL
jgi:hypothetical protein